LNQVEQRIVSTRFSTIELSPLSEKLVFKPFAFKFNSNHYVAAAVESSKKLSGWELHVKLTDEAHGGAVQPLTPPDP
jgi:hypothetical protein